MLISSRHEMTGRYCFSPAVAPETRLVSRPAIGSWEVFYNINYRLVMHGAENPVGENRAFTRGG